MEEYRCGGLSGGNLIVSVSPLTILPSNTSFNSVLQITLVFYFHSYSVFTRLFRHVHNKMKNVETVDLVSVMQFLSSV